MDKEINPCGIKSVLGWPHWSSFTLIAFGKNQAQKMIAFRILYVRKCCPSAHKAANIFKVSLTSAALWDNLYTRTNCSLKIPPMYKVLISLSTFGMQVFIFYFFYWINCFLWTESQHDDTVQNPVPKSSFLDSLFKNLLSWGLLTYTGFLHK